MERAPLLGERNMTAECGDGVLGVVELCDKTTPCGVRSFCGRWSKCTVRDRMPVDIEDGMNFGMMLSVWM